EPAEPGDAGEEGPRRHACGRPPQACIGGRAHAGTSRRARRPLTRWRAHHTARKRAAPPDRPSPTPDAAVDRTVKRVRPTVRAPSGDSSTMRIGNVPDVRAETGKRSVVVRLGARSSRRVGPAGNVSF